MKFIFDFDDTLLDTKKLKQHIFSIIEKYGFSRENAEKSYIQIRHTDIPFSLKDFLSQFTKDNSLIEKMYKDILDLAPKILHHDIVKMVKRIGKENVFIITNGEEVYQNDKINAAGIRDLFSEIHVVPGSKKDLIADICQKYPDEEVYFLDDKLLFIEDIDLDKCKNLKTILYDKSDFLKYLEKVISK